jgi:type I restriction enzyme S subunit
MPQDLDDGSIVTHKIARVAEKHAERLKQHRLLAGDIVYSRRGDVGRFAVVTEAEAGWLCGTGCIRVRFNCPDLRIDYVRRYLQQESVQGWLRHHARGVTMPNLNTTVVRALPIVYTSGETQRRIAEILDKADALRAKRRATLAQLDTLTQSIFLDMFGEELDASPVDTAPDRARTPRGCSWELLANVARLATGHTPDRERSEYWNGEIPWISLTDIRSLDGAIAEETLQRITPLGIENSSAVLLPKGTVCFSRTASVGFVTVMGREMATSQDFMNWVCGPRLDPTYLMWALVMSRHRLLALSSGSTHRTIYMRVVDQFRVLLPSIELQREFARRVAKVEVSKAAMRAALSELDALFGSLQYRAFRGQL